MTQRSTGTKSVCRERRKHWRDRRLLSDRRNPERLLHAGVDCRSGTPRRESDIGGELSDGDIWWESDRTRYDD